jgi:uncharacterized protein
MQFLAFSLKQTLSVGFVSLAVISIPSVTLAVPVDQVPNPRQVNGTWVTDMADILSPATEAELNQIINQLEVKNGTEIAVVTVPETSPSATPKQFATTLFNHWHIGKAEKDNGVLFLISKGDRRVEIETGYGVESILPNALVGDIISQEITPRFKQGDYNGGTIAGTKALLVKLETNNPPANLTIEQPWYAQIPWYVWLGGAGGVAVTLWAIISHRRSGSRKSRLASSNSIVSPSNNSWTTSSIASPNSNSSTVSSKSNSTSSSDRTNIWNPDSISPASIDCDSSSDSPSSYNSSSSDSPSSYSSSDSPSSYNSSSSDSPSSYNSSSSDSPSSYNSSSSDSSSSYSSSSSDSSNSYSSSSSDSSNSYSSSDFGGGSSDGGGGGGSW